MATLPEMVKAVKAYALTHCAEGWDVVIECYTDSDIEDLIKGATTEMGALRKVSKEVRLRADFGLEIRSA